LKEQEFINAIEELVIAFEASGVNNENLKNTIDRLFDIKELLIVKQGLTRDTSTCMTCSFNKEGACTFLSLEVGENFTMTFFPPDTRQGENTGSKYFQV
jgi:hypothetical protein